MDRYCILCGSKIENNQGYLEKKKTLVRTTRYQEVIDVLIDSSLYSQIFFDHDTELPSPYRKIALHKRNALQEEQGKGWHLQKKRPDVVGVKNDICDIIIEEERQPTSEKINNDIHLITKCKYLWANGRLYDLGNPSLFILINENVNNLNNSIRENIGTFKKVIVCDKNEFEDMYEMYYLEL